MFLKELHHNIPYNLIFYILFGFNCLELFDKYNFNFRFHEILIKTVYYNWYLKVNVQKGTFMNNSQKNLKSSSFLGTFIYVGATDYDIYGVGGYDATNTL